MSYVKYRDIVAQLDIPKDSILLVSSDVMRLVLTCAKNGEKFDANIFIDTLKDAVGKGGTILFSTYNWDFCKGVPFDYLKTEGKTGTLGNIALMRPDFKRTKHPLYSFAVCGRDKELLCAMDNKSSFGKDSPFNYLYENNAISLGIDLHINQYYTFVYYAQELVGVKFRYPKDFTAEYIDENGNSSTRTYSMYVRDLELNPVANMYGLYDIFLEKNIAKEKVINGITYSQVDINKSYSIIEEDILYNNSKNQYIYKGQ